MRFYTIILALVLFFTSCNRVKNKAKETINKSGELAGEAASEFIEGFSDGIDESIKQSLNFSEELSQMGLSYGTFSVKNDSVGKDNLLNVYFIFNEDFEKVIKAKAFNERGLEIGRASCYVSGKKGQAAYFDFGFNKQTRIEVKGKIILD